MDGIGGYAGWRWLFFIEGAISFVVGIAGFWLFPDNPETAYFLSKEERELARVRLIAQGNYEKFEFAQVKAVLTDPIYWLSGIINLCANIYNYSKFELSPAGM
jgi:hypothetical protein